MDKYTGAGLISIAMGGLSLILGVLFRTGLVQADLASQYRDPAAPVTQRNGVFGFIPLGLASVALGLLPLIATSRWGIVLALITLTMFPWPSHVYEAPIRCLGYGDISWRHPVRAGAPPPASRPACRAAGAAPAGR